jgi:hypothetical protein
MELKSTTKMAFQAAIAIAISELISMCFYVDRGYWITVTAMALTTQTWGESVKRSFERVGMTVLGGVAGTILYFYLPENEPKMLLLLALSCTFFTVYFAKIYSLISVFFLTCFVVFLFALIGAWNLMLLRARILDTALGAVVALVVGFFFFSLKTNIPDLFIEYLQKMKATMIAAFDVSCQPETLITGQSLSVDFQQIKKNALSIRYELLFHRLNPHDFNVLLNQVAFCTQFVTNLIDAYGWLVPHLTKEEGAIIAVAAKTSEHNINTIIQLLKKNNQEPMLPASNLAGFLKKSIEDEPHRFATLESDALGFFNLMYFFKRLNICLNEVYLILHKAY